MFKRIGLAQFSSTWNVKLTSNAVSRIWELSKQNPDKTLRLSLSGGGCSGFAYQFDLDSNQNQSQNDIIYEQEGARIITDNESLQYIQGIVVDFKTDIMERKFAVSDNPQAGSKCSCGSSFSPK